MTGNHYLYRFYGALGELLYIGITNSLETRFTDHRKSKLWWADVASMTVEVLSSRDEAIEAEREAIKLEQPRYNRIYAEERDLRYAPRWQRLFKLDDLPEDNADLTEHDWIKVLIASNIKDWAHGYDGRTGCIKIHPDMFQALVRNIAEAVEYRMSNHA